ncbi:peptidylprolyl isomerase [Porphyromonadaceae bacterium OttesenSCG-928-L07]|nr:peptidylprolyl isomerase [Porphyromonadaceae bacterium OttesenSCG-928-L07]MDL2330785.1 peptidylprolyl isomerase [Odoribacter sp. OttesenSCG-928-A06]
MLKMGLKTTIFLLFFSGLILLSSCENAEDKILTINTNMGFIKVKLYNETPMHRDNFVRLAKEGYYDGILFHRVINGFVIQAGDPESKHARPGMILGNNDIDHVVKSEIRSDLFHRRGVLAAARQEDHVNPDRNSSGGHFYIVQGKQYSPGELDSMVNVINERRRLGIFRQISGKYEADIQRFTAQNNLEELEKLTKQISAESRSLFDQVQLVLTQEQKEIYTTQGGIPGLDGLYTVFGEVIEGMDVVDRIALLKTDEYNRPEEDVIILKIEMQ